MARNIARDEQEAERRRKQLLEAGFDLFSRHGIEAISLQMVADTAEVGVATLYKYYQNKLNRYQCRGLGKCVEGELRDFWS